MKVKELQRLQQEVAGRYSELVKLDEIEAKHRETIFQATSSDITTEEAQRKISDARFGIGIVESRRAKLREPLGVSRRTLVDQFHVEVDRWNVFVLAKGDQAAERVFQANREFWGDQEKRQRREFDPEETPYVTKIRRAHFDRGSSSYPDEEILQSFVKNFISHVERHCEANGWKYAA